MRPQELVLTNFGPFINETIDFSRLTEAALFLISGNTGTGKTTIFDGMTYALFGETSGNLRTGMEMRSSFASPEEETAVVFTFEHQGLFYKISRRPKQVLKKKRGTGVRSQEPKAELTIFSLDGKEERQYSKIGEVNQQVTELLHLNAQQFSQIVLLPQGEFRNFLIANSDEKEKILRHLFGTEMYQKMGELLNTRRKKASEKLKTSSLELELLQKRFSWEKTPDKDLASQAFIEQAKNQISQQKEQLKATKEQQKKLEEAGTAAEQAYYQAREVKSLFQQQAALVNEQLNLKQQAETISQKQIHLNDLEWAQKQRGAVEKLGELNRQQQNLLEKETTIRQSTTQNQQEAEQLKVQLKEVSEQEPDYQKNQERLGEIQRQLPLLQTLQNHRNQLQQTEASIKEVNSQQQQVLKDAEKLNQALEQSQKQQQQEPRLQKNMTILVQYQNQLKELKKLDGQTIDQKQKISDKQLEIKKLEKKIVNQQEKIQQQSDYFLQLKSDAAKMQIAKLSLNLLPGEPCPVCGSTEHPSVGRANETYSFQEIADVEAKAEKTEKDLSSSKERLAKLETKQQLLQQQLAKEQEELEKSSQDFTLNFDKLKAQLTAERKVVLSTIADVENYLQDEEKATQEGLSEVETAKQRVISQQLGQQKLQTRLKEFQQRLEEMASKKNQLTGAVENLVSQGVLGEPKELEKEQKGLKQWVETFDQHKQILQEQKLQLEQQQIRLSEQRLQTEKTLKETLQQISEVNNQLQQVLQEHDTTMETLRVLLQDTQHIEKLREKINEYLTQVKINAQQLEKTVQQLEGKTEPDLVIFQDTLEAAKEEVKKIQEDTFQQKNSLRQNSQTLTDFTALFQKNQQQLETLTQLSELSKTINGENPKKTSLERFVLQTYLSEVLEVANQRLSRLTRDRYQFELSTDTGSYRNQTGLEINVFDDDAGTSRSVHTLSGGESFIAALALALSLAEVIQSQAGGLSIEALFIDEGFGSLDEDSLNMAMEALESIESEGRMIGIISHVRELKERVPQKILVTSVGGGQSRIDYQF